MQVVSKDQEVSMLKDLGIYLILLGFALLIIAVMAIGMVVHKYREQIKQALSSIKKKTFWNNTIKSVLIAYLDLCHGATA